MLEKMNRIYLKMQIKVRLYYWKS